MGVTLMAIASMEVATAIDTRGEKRGGLSLQPIGLRRQAREPVVNVWHDAKRGICSSGKMDFPEAR